MTLFGRPIDWAAACAYFASLSFPGEDTPVARHDYQPTLNVPVMVCANCGKWPMHHNHQDITADLCTCDDHQASP